MRWPLDAVIIDRVFQPAADRLAGYISCFDLARFFADGVMLVVLFTVAITLYSSSGQIDWVTPGLAVFCVLGLGALRYVVGRLERSCKSGLANPARHSLFVARVMALYEVILEIIRLARMQDWFSFLLLGVVLAILCAAYFASCYPNPPTFKLAKNLVGAR